MSFSLLQISTLINTTVCSTHGKWFVIGEKEGRETNKSIYDNFIGHKNGLVLFPYYLVWWCPYYEAVKKSLIIMTWVRSYMLNIFLVSLTLAFTMRNYHENCEWKDN